MIGMMEATPTAAGDRQDQLVAALRLELESYGGLLTHFDAQQEAILMRQPDLVLEINNRIEQHLETSKASRKHREAIARQVAEAAGFPEQVSLKELAPYFRSAVRPMIEALTAEVNRLINHTRRRAQQNQLLLTRAMEVTQDILGRLSPDSITRTYSPGGKVRMNAGIRTSRLLDQG